MNDICAHISERVHAVANKRDFLDLIFADHKKEALNGGNVVLFGAGELGHEVNNTLRNNGILPACFCDNDYSKSGTTYLDIPIISFDELRNAHKNSLILLTVAKEQYLESIEQQLLQNGFSSDRILCKSSDMGDNLQPMHMYANSCAINSSGHLNSSRVLLDELLANEQQILDAYSLMSDTKSKELFIAKLALMASNQHYELFKEFMLNYSEPIRTFGLSNRHRQTEEYFYFNNDIIHLSPDEIYIDVGAADGDTVHPFITACSDHAISYKRIYAFEPDPHNYHELTKNTATYSRYLVTN